ncbi:MAG: hypothetical protein IKV55_01635 [Oscillospiraceae bacterium]|nr:hypothetical protein [Oscillospiraceae bacterium]
MNLKEAFRFQNKLQQLMAEGESIIGNEKNITRVTTTYLRNKAMAEAKNETLIDEPASEYAQQITEMVEFLLYLLAQREVLSAAIRTAKAALETDLDGEVGLNGIRQHLARTLANMADLRSTQVYVRNGGSGYRFNAEGNQVMYYCDAERTTTINFDRKKVRSALAALNKKADTVSAQLDLCMLSAEVDYEAPFDVNDSFAAVFEAYLSAGA